MVEFSKRPEVTINHMGKVHNPSGEGVAAISSKVQAKISKFAAGKSNGSNKDAPGGIHEEHETKVKEGTAKRNITRKKTSDRDTGNYNSSYKKQGGHGKGKWKEAMDPSYVEDLPIDEKDPIYDAAEDSNKYILSSASNVVDPGCSGFDPQTEKAVYGPLLTESEFKFQIGECLKEYFDSCDADEVIRSLEELGCKEYHPEIIKKAISLAMDKSPRERELTSRLLSCLQPMPLSHTNMETGFTILLDGLDELSKDVPDAKNNSRPGDEVVEKAISLLSREHCNARLERVWGPGDGRPVEELKKDMDQLLKEYLLSRELDEAACCVKELQAPHFHHELVKRGGVAAMELDGKSVDEELANIDAMAALFGFLTRNAIVSTNQVNKGVDRLYKILSDITLDVPAAPTLLEAFKKCLIDQDCLAAPTQESKQGETI